MPEEPLRYFERVPGGQWTVAPWITLSQSTIDRWRREQEFNRKAHAESEICAPDCPERWPVNE